MPKTFDVGEIVMFQREPGARWELAEYMSPAGDDMPGWHRIRDDRGFREVHHVPSRRIKRPDYDKHIASNYDPHGTGR